MKVFIWGCYNQGNFGDDLMGIIFSKLLEKEGCDVRCYRLSSYLSNKYNIETTHSVKDAIEWCDYIIIGGGAFFKQEHETHPMINKDLVELSNELRKTDKKLYCLSVGSDNVSNKVDLYSPRREIIESKNFSGGSVRIKTDIDTFEMVNTEYLEDIILTLPIALNYLNLNNKTTSGLLKNRTVINFSKKNFLKSLFNIKLWPLLIKSVYFKSHDSDSGIKSEAYIPFLSHFENKDPIVSSFELSESKSITSTKLHVGVAACAFGVGFKSVYGNEKTRTFLKQSSDILDNKNGYYSFNDKNKQNVIFNEYLRVISNIVRNNR